jgi:lipoate---protein ligase
MKYIDTDYDVPYMNFALEEYLLTDAPKEDFIFFYIHKPSVIVGRHQNTLEEINKTFVDKEGIIVARRLSGGGAVYHDDGNLNFSFVQTAHESDMNNFEKFTRPIIKALKKIGIQAELSGRNDILIEDRKISGNAQYYKDGRILSHGTLLFNANLAKLSQALNVKELKIQSKGIKSIQSRVANIIDYLDTPITIYEFKKMILDFLNDDLGIEEYVLSNLELDHIERLAKSKFELWEWNWGRSPNFAIQKMDKFSCGIIDVRLDVAKGIILNCKIYGDFFSLNDISELEGRMLDIKYDRAALKEVLKDEFIAKYFKDLSAETFINFIVD